MIKKLIHRIFFFSDNKQNKAINEFNSNTNLRTNEAILEAEADIKHTPNIELKKGEVQSVLRPEIDNQENLILTNWYFKIGDIINKGDIVCDIENENIVMEFESIFSGRIISTCKLNQKLDSGTELFEIEGI